MTENVAPTNNKTKDESFLSPGSKAAKAYRKVNQREHVLLRPDTYVGSVQPITKPMWVWDDATQSLGEKEITYVPALYKIFDEILVNAADNKQRDKSMTWIKVEIDGENGVISVCNNGKGIPVVMHKKEKMYVPELIFGNLLTSDNYNDKKKKTTGGRNGYGAKLANIFSVEFTVETVDCSQKKKYSQTWFDNMTRKSDPVIKSCASKGASDYTKVIFKPDFQKFGMTKMDPDTVALFKKRVYDMAGITDSSVRVWLNGKKIDARNFKDYVTLCQKSSLEKLRAEGREAKMQYLKVNDRWEIAVCASAGQFEQVSFVNSICTTKGGTHTNYIADQIAKALEKEFKKKNKKAKGMTKAQIKNFFCVFVNALIENPAFDSQTKETLTTPARSFGSTAELSPKFLKSVCHKSMGIVEALLSYASFKSRKIGKEGRKTKNVRGIPKLDDANKAGTRESSKCVLIVTEGDSAKTLAVSGLSIVGRDYFGIFPLKGKPLNVREAKHAQIANNEEIQNIIKIMGLKRDVVYTAENIKQLRYGSIMIMADQDHDGSHIKGLLINFLHWYNPSLIRLAGFVREFITPIVKASRKGKKKEQPLIFYTMPEYESWVETQQSANPNFGKKWNIKYYKGLGTSTAKEAKEYFGRIEENMLNFAWQETDAECIALAFAAGKRNERKTWISSVNADTYLDHKQCSKDGFVRYDAFFNKEYVLYSKASVVRAIPSVVDGFKPSQRKVLYSCFKRKLHSDLKVAQLAGYVSEHGAYHHGEASLMGTIVGMAQNFVGSNNINLLFPSGQFGTRLQGGNDSASPRYIFTKLAKITRTIFPESDDPVLNYLSEEGETIEPEFYCPIVPMALINGCSGIATGWSTEVPNFRPEDVIANIRRKLKGESMLPMTPWYRGFTGEIKQNGTKCGSYVSLGIAELLEHPDDGTNLKVFISELPIGMWTQKYKEMLESMLVTSSKKKTKKDASAKETESKKSKKKKNTDILLDFNANHTDTTVSFELIFQPGVTLGIKPESNPMDSEEFVKTMKLQSKMSTNNMMLVCPNSVRESENGAKLVTKFDTPLELIDAFFKARLSMYGKRKAHMLAELRADFKKLSNQARFVLEFVEGTLQISRRKESEIAKDLVSKGYDRIYKSQKKKIKNTADNDGNGATKEGEVDSLSGYEYLVSMNIRSLTLERVETLRRKLMTKKTELETLEKLSLEELWNIDLVKFEDALADFEKMLQDDKEEEEAARKSRNARTGGKKKKKRSRKPKKVTKPIVAEIVTTTKKEPVPVAALEVEEATKEVDQDDLPLAMRMMAKMAVSPDPVKTKTKRVLQKKAATSVPSAKSCEALPPVSVLKKLKVAEIKTLLRQRGLPLKGKKAELIERLLASDNTDSPCKKRFDARPSPAKPVEVAPSSNLVDMTASDHDEVATPSPVVRRRPQRRNENTTRVNYADMIDDEDADPAQDSEEEFRIEDASYVDDDDADSDWE